MAACKGNLFLKVLGAQGAEVSLLADLDGLRAAAAKEARLRRAASKVATEGLPAEIGCALLVLHSAGCALLAAHRNFASLWMSFVAGGHLPRCDPWA